MDNSPGSVVDSGFSDLEFDRAGGMLYFADELPRTIRRCQADGTGLETIYTGPSSHSPTSLTLDLDPPQPMQDCNSNGVRDIDDIEGGSSGDCNNNGIPDECEVNPCTPIAWDLDQGSDPLPNGRLLSGNPSTGYDVFQPFDIVTLPGVPGVSLRRIGLDGWTLNHDPAGFRATIFPDNGSGMPDETRPLGQADMQFRFSPNTVVWIYADMSAFLPAGRYYVRLKANSMPYEASVNVGTSGPTSFSRRLSNGQIIQSSSPIAFRLLFGGTAAVPEQPGTEPRHGWLSLAAPLPNPFSREVLVVYQAEDAARIEGEVLDAAGRLVRSLDAESRPVAGSALRWDGIDASGRPCPSGIYFLRVRAGSSVGAVVSDTRRLVLVR